MKLLDKEVIKRYLGQYYKFLLIGLFLILVAFMILLFELFDMGYFPFALICLGIFIIFYYLYKLIIFRAAILGMDESLINEITDKIVKYKYVVYDHMGVLCFDKYFINMTNGFKIVKYCDIERCFYKKNVLSSNVICYFLTNGEKYKIKDLLLNMDIKSVNEFMQHIRKNNSKTKIYSIKKHINYIKEYYFRKYR